MSAGNSSRQCLSQHYTCDPQLPIGTGRTWLIVVVIVAGIVAVIGPVMVAVHVNGKCARTSLVGEESM